MRQPRVVSIVNHKGGCLKTTVTVNLGAALARAGRRVLLIDLDAQQNLTQSLLGHIPYEEGTPTLYDALLEESGLHHLIRSTAIDGLDVVPCSEDFAGADLSLVSVMGRESILRGCLERTGGLDRYDFVLLDNPPSISLVVVNALVASDYFLVPCSAEYLPMVGLSLLGHSIGNLRKVAPDLQMLGVVVTLFSKNESICKQVDSMLRQDLEGKVFDTRIRVNTKAKAAPAVKQTIFEFEANEEGRGTEDFRMLAEEFLVRLASMETPSRRELVANG
jgi:chromosome partitioning protein